MEYCRMKQREEGLDGLGWRFFLTAFIDLRGVLARFPEFFGRTNRKS